MRSIVIRGADLPALLCTAALAACASHAAKQAAPPPTNGTIAQNVLEKPFAAGVAKVTVVATVIAIDRSTSQVVLRGPDGEEVKTHDRDPRRLEAAKVGDRVALTYSEGVAVSVEKAPSH